MLRPESNCGRTYRFPIRLVSYFEFAPDPAGAVLKDRPCPARGAEAENSLAVPRRRNELLQQP